MNHSSLQPRGTPLSKLGPRGSRHDEKAARLAQDRRELSEAYKLVDRRDGSRCRVCGRRCSPSAIGLMERAERHHLIKRSQGGAHHSANLILLCQRCHDDVHKRVLLRLSGDADLRDARGRLAGIRVERLVREVWTTVGMV